MANLRRVQAQERIHDGKFNPVDFRGVKQLYLEAYGDPVLAEEAQTAALERLVQQETEAARQGAARK